MTPKLLLVLLVSILALAIVGCNSGGAGGGGSSTSLVRLHGTITDRSGTGIHQASIELSESTVTTESDGGFDVRIEMRAIPERVTYQITRDGGGVLFDGCCISSYTYYKSELSMSRPFATVQTRSL